MNYLRSKSRRVKGKAKKRWFGIKKEVKRG